VDGAGGQDEKCFSRTGDGGQEGTKMVGKVLKNLINSPIIHELALGDLDSWWVCSPRLKVKMLVHHPSRHKTLLSKAKG
jgi:hypothetical protein